MYLDFGNGIIAGGTASAAVRITDHGGLEFPVPEVTFQEHGVLDGGRYVTSRSPSRLMWVQASAFGYTRADIVSAFRVGTEYTLTSEKGSIPYYVEGLTFLSPNLVRTPRFVLTMHSPDAYPTVMTDGTEVGSLTGMEWPHEWPHHYGTLEAVSSFVVNNTGGIVAEPTITATVASGGVLEVWVGSEGKFLVTVEEGDIVTIDAYERIVKLNGTTDYSTMDYASVWPALQPGYNTIHFSQPVVASATWGVHDVGIL